MRAGGLLLAAAALALPAQARTARPAIAFTFDDLPVHSALPPDETRLDVIRKIIAALKDGGLKDVYGFINASGAEKEPALAAAFDDWRAAGFPLGNHTWSHVSLDRVDLPAYLAEIERNEPILKAKMGDGDWRWLRYPFLDEGQDPAKRMAVRQWLADHHYRIAQVTMSFGDYMWNDVYARCAAKGDQAAIAELEASYLKAASEVAAAARADQRAIHGRDIPYVLLMHVGAFDARMLPRLIAQYKSEGFRFVTLPQAEKDPAYAADMNPALPPAPPLADQLRARGAARAPITSYGPILAAMCQP